MGKPQKMKKKNKISMAEQADRHELYQNTVQCVESEIDFVDKAFREIRGHKASLIREDFCGTFAASCEWIMRRDDNRAICVDIDPDVQQWGREHNLSKLNEDQASRIEVITADVNEVDTPPVDMVLAMNFSYWYFKTRDQLRAYYKRVHSALKNDGVLFMDAFGGHEAFEEMTEEREEDGYTYIWDQAKYNPITADYRCHIHFEFPDGSRINKAFTYEWRLWTLPEIRELLEEAGFSRVTVYWDMAEDDDEDDYQPSMKGEADPGWLVYIAAEK